MSSSSDEDLGFDWVPYSQRSDWADVTPLEQDDGDKPVVAIAYSTKFREVFNYVRAIIATGEKSKRALELTTEALRLNPANYTVWHYRREILRALNSDLNLELNYLQQIIRSNAKNYQVWHHRRAIVEMLGDPSNELEFTETALELDAKNYHAWQHRQWAIKTYNLYDDELRFVDRLIAEDIRNNSAWNQRFFVIKHFGLTPEVLAGEIQYTMNRIGVVKNNESAWNYLVGLLRYSGEAGQNALSEVLEFSEELYNNGSRSPYLIAFLIDTYKAQCLNKNDVDDREALSRRVYNLCDEMSKKHDVIRRKYWQYVADELKKELNGNN